MSILMESIFQQLMGYGENGVHGQFRWRARQRSKGRESARIQNLNTAARSALAPMKNWWMLCYVSKLFKKKQCTALIVMKQIINNKILNYNIINVVHRMLFLMVATNGNWGPWGPWSDLSGQTNPETRFRKRACDNPSPANGGSFCSGFDAEEETVYKRWSNNFIANVLNIKVSHISKILY